MYDYISIRKDERYSESVTVEEINNLAKEVIGIHKVGKVSFTKKIGEFTIGIRGIMATDQGSYAYDNDTEFDEVNLIEIDIPPGSEQEFETEILQLAIEFARALDWQVEDHETDRILFG